MKIDKILDMTIREINEAYGKHCDTPLCIGCPFDDMEELNKYEDAEDMIDALCSIVCGAHNLNKLLIDSKKEERMKAIKDTIADDLFRMVSVKTKRENDPRLTPEELGGMLSKMTGARYIIFQHTLDRYTVRVLGAESKKNDRYEGMFSMGTYPRELLFLPNGLGNGIELDFGRKG